MRPSEVLEKNREAIREATKRFNAANPRVFGSVARGEDRPDSDLDILVDALPGTTLFDLGGLLEELKALLGVEVDVVTSGGQVIASCGDLRARGAVVDHAVCVIDRESGGPAGLAAIDVELRALYTMSELTGAAG